MRPMYRQGDILIIPVDEIPADTKPVAREHGKLILAHGEITGHHHAFDIDVENVELVTADQAAELYLLVHGTEAAPLTHQEHATIPVEPGRYRVRRQREYAPEAIRQVQD
jgi:hypothetical protein